ncbi:DUF6745 domain-containing protein [Streptomyces sp. CA2R106]|uniref:DUF6745 domain-containing protein n=1 Tax=Streptomyces sp. CA2R106 TaxID=3120153 RepID=UPI00300825E5
MDGNAMSMVDAVGTATDPAGVVGQVAPVAPVGGAAGEGAPGDPVRVWREYASATGPADRAAAERGIRLAYTRAGLPQPREIRWVGSPREAVDVLRALPDAGPSLREQIRTAPWAAERARLHTELGAAGWSAHWGASGGRLWAATQALVDRVREGVVEDVTGVAPTAPGGATGGAAGLPREERAAYERVATEVRLLMLDAVLGQHDAPWLAAFPADLPPLDGLAQVCRHAGWWWPFARVAVVSERPVALHRDEAGRLDHGAGPALAYPDGFALHAWRGMPVPASFLAELGALTPDRIRAEENAELRRVMLEYYGYDRYLAESGARPVHRDETGVLWRIDLTGDEPVVMVEVVNSTPEPDGTHRTYWLRVPPSTRTAREGVAWTFGVAAEAYEPMQQT